MSNFFESTPDWAISIASTGGIEKLRKPDVYRALCMAKEGGILAETAAYIKRLRPDLAAEADECVGDINAGL